MDSAVVFGVVFVVGLALSTYLRHTRPASLAAATHRYARRVDLALDERNEAQVSRRLARREKAGALGGALVGLVTLGWLVLGAAPSQTASSGGLLAVVLGYFLGHAVGYAVVAWYESSRPAPAGVPRVARVTTPTHDDYVAPHERRGAWLAAALSVAVAATVVVLDAGGWVELGPVPWSLVVLAVVGPVLAVVLDEVVARRLVRRRQVARTSLELAWDDALRARTLRDMVTVVIVVACYAPLVLLGTIGDRLAGGWPANPAVGVVNGLFCLVLLVMLGGALVSVALDPQRHVRRRLWPDPAPAEVVPTGPGGGPAGLGAARGPAGDLP